MRISKTLPAVLFALGMSGPSHAAGKIAADLVLTKATLIDVAGGKAVKGKSVVLKGDTIIAVVDDKALANYAPKKTVRLPGKYLMPGLWDTHIHYGGGPELIEENKRLMPLYLAHGVTAVRDCSGDLADTVLEWRHQIASGQMSGPTIFTSGAKLEGVKPLWKGTIEVGTAAEVGAALDQLQAWKVDFVKITENTMTPAIYLEALRQARARGMRTSGHVPAQLTLDQVADAGLGTVEHQSYLLRATTPREGELTAQVADGRLTAREAMKLSLESYDEATARAAFRRLAAAGTAVVPTLYGSYVTAYLDRDDHSRDAYLQYIGKGLRATYDWRVQRAAKDGPEAIALRHAIFEKSAALLPLLAREGVSIIAGTDAGFLNSYDYPGVSLHDEIGLYVKYGLTPAQALQSAVVAGPRFLGKLDRYGAVAEGKAADLLVLDADPLKDIAATRKIRMVVSRGAVHDRASLDRMLAGVKAWVARQP
ncbi:amidohydrolase family protein [Pseudoduganella namucuonensis]|uniref:Imidazolonepropionase n=1 Tax=Pseudoduganella namucuonensis TaxID=1035707 RepID=A0A1I7L9H3_9BURK|nr:amidohydrolase family protein [Pseudoduganella namucuonensis]SFV06335.1 Imidazolonepropionase [Pseudoduganella namucuonensis]